MAELRSKLVQAVQNYIDRTKRDASLQERGAAANSGGVGAPSLFLLSQAGLVEAEAGVVEEEVA